MILLRIDRLLREIGIGLFLTLLAAVLITPAKPAWAHAQLIYSSPEDSAILDDAPGEVRLWFNEAVSDRFSSARLLDASGSAIPLLSIQRDPTDDTLLILTLPQLSPGLYRVDWRVLSETDGHFTTGILVFGVGEVDAIGATPLPAANPPPLLEVLIRWLNYAVIVALAGAIAIENLVVSRLPLLSETPGVILAGRRRLLVWSALCSIVGLVVGLWMLFYQGGVLRGALPQGVSMGETIWQILNNTRWGALWMLRQGIILVLAAILTLILRLGAYPEVSRKIPDNPKAAPDRLPALMRFGGWVAILVLLTAQALNSHAAGLGSSTTQAVVMDILHLLAASVWAGGLLSLAIAFFPAISRAGQNSRLLLRAIWGRFSLWALISVITLALTGLYSVGRQVVSPDALLTSLYGNVLLGKVGVMLVMGIFGLLNSMFLHPLLLQPLRRLLHLSPKWTPLSPRLFPTLVMFEIGLGFMVLFAAGVITASEPARGPRFPVSYGAIPSSQTKSVADLLVTFSVRPNQPGDNIITVRAVSSWQPPPGEVLRVILHIKPQEEVLDPISIDAQPVGDAEYQAGGGYFRFSGRWDVDVVIRRKGIEDQVTHFDWIVPPAAPGDPPILSDYPWGPILTHVASALLSYLLFVSVGVWVLKRFW